MMNRCTSTCNSHESREQGEKITDIVAYLSRIEAGSKDIKKALDKLSSQLLKIQQVSFSSNLQIHNVDLQDEPNQIDSDDDDDSIVSVELHMNSINVENPETNNDLNF